MQGADERGRWILWLESAEIDEDLVGGFQLRRIPQNARVDRRCTVLRGAAARIELSGKFGLGSPRERILEALGPPTVIENAGRTLIYLHQHQEEKMGDPKGPQPFPVVNNVIILLKQGVVEAIGATKYTLW